jgi:hypothetical protein
MPGERKIKPFCMFYFLSKINNISMLQVVTESELKNISVKIEAGLVQYGIWIYLCRPVRKKVCEKVVEWGTKRSSLTGWTEHIIWI